MEEAKLALEEQRVAPTPEGQRKQDVVYKGRVTSRSDEATAERERIIASKGQQFRNRNYLGIRRKVA
jgi:hypothetical protein